MISPRTGDLLEFGLASGFDEVLAEFEERTVVRLLEGVLRRCAGVPNVGGSIIVTEDINDEDSAAESCDGRSLFGVFALELFLGDRLPLADNILDLSS